MKVSSSPKARYASLRIEIDTRQTFPSSKGEGERCIPRPLLPSGSAGVRGNAIYAFPTFHSSIECGRMCKRREVEGRGNSTAGERVDRINFPFVRIMEM